VTLLDRFAEFRHNGVVKINPEVTSAASAALPTPGGVVAPTSDGHTRRAIVQLLLGGAITAGEIGERLGISAAGVRRHLDALIDAGDAESHAAAVWQHHGRGRPAKRYRLTAAGRAKLDHAYDDLAVAAMRQLRELGGDEAIRTFARRRIDAILGEPDQASDADVEGAANRIAAALTEAGYATTTTRVTGAIDGVQICQHHCPVSHVAEEFPELCETEREAFAELLGTHVQRLATIVNGDSACTTHVPVSSEKSPPATPGPPKRSSIRPTARAEVTTTRQGAST
jgi:predicted ArsR family transcriptional regulator